MRKTIKLNIQWRDYQRNTIKSILDADLGTKHVVVYPRQCGKTVASEAILLYCSINNKNAFSLFVSPTQKQCRKVFKEVRKSLQSTPLLEKANESTLEITLTNGSSIIFCSAEQGIASLQGYTIRGGGVLIVDESAFIQPDIFYALFPICDAHRAKMILVSTPRFRDPTNVFYQYYCIGEGKNEDGIFSYNWKGNSMLSQKQLEFYKKTLPENSFRNYYLGEFTDVGGGLFGSLTDCISDDYEPTRPDTIHQKGVSCIMSIDWSSGSGGDETAITVFNSLRQMMYIEHFNDKDANETIDRVLELLRFYKPTKLVVEMNSIGKVFYDVLQKRMRAANIPTSLKGFNTTNDSKNKIVNKFQVAIQNKEVTILNNDRLLSQLSNYAAELTPSGKITYNAPKGTNDDLVLSTLIGYNELTTGNYSYI